MKKIGMGLLTVLVLLTACKNKQMSPEEMQHKLDSIARLENVERLKAQGIDLSREISPVQLFYDSLNIQPLPLRFSDDYVF